MWNLGCQSPPFGLEYEFQEDREIVLFKTLSWYLAYYGHLNDHNELINEWIICVHNGAGSQPEYIKCPISLVNYQTHIWRMYMVYRICILKIHSRYKYVFLSLISFFHPSFLRITERIIILHDYVFSYLHIFLFIHSTHISLLLSLVL